MYIFCMLIILVWTFNYYCIFFLFRANVFSNELKHRKEVVIQILVVCFSSIAKSDDSLHSYIYALNRLCAVSISRVQEGLEKIASSCHKRYYSILVETLCPVDMRVIIVEVPLFEVQKSWMYLVIWTYRYKNTQHFVFIVCHYRTVLVLWKVLKCLQLMEYP